MKKLNVNTSQDPQVPSVLGLPAKAFLFLVLSMLVSAPVAWVLSASWDQKQSDLTVAKAKSTATENLRDFARNFDLSIAHLHGFPAALSRDSLVQTAVKTKVPPHGLNPNLASLTKDIGIDLAFILDNHGLCLAASNASTPDSLVGETFADREYFREAQIGLNGMQYAMGRRTNIPGIFFSSPIVINNVFYGVSVIKINVSSINEIVGVKNAFITDEYDVVILATDPEWLMMSLPGARILNMDSSAHILAYKRDNFPVLPIVYPIRPDSPFYFGTDKIPAFMASMPLKDMGMTAHMVSFIGDRQAEIHRQRFFLFVLIYTGLCALAWGGALSWVHIYRIRLHNRAVKESANRFRQVLETSGEGIIGLDRSAKISFANPSAALILGWQSPDDMLGLFSTEVFEHRLHNHYPCSAENCQIRATLSDGQSRRVSTEYFKGLNREEIAVEYVVSPLINAEGIHGAVVAFHDISELTRVLTNLTRSNAELEQFAYVVSHDLRQPLRMVASYLALISRKLAGEHKLDSEFQMFLNYANEGATRMDRLILALLDYSRSGENMVVETVNLEKIVGECIQNLKVSITENEAEITIESPLANVRASHLEMTQIFQNLISNAIKYHAPNRPPKIEIHSEVKGGMVEIAVKDNGIGISPDNYDRVFKVFQRLVAMDQFEGNGIGLSICRKVIERLGGSIWIESAIGQGSTFFITIPSG